MLSREKHYLADAPPRLDELVGAVDVLERQLRADDRLEGAGLPLREQLADGGADEPRIEAHQPTEVEAVQADVAPDEPGRVDRRPRSAGRSDRDHGPERAQPRKRAGEEVAADGVEDDVDLELVRQLVVRERLGAEGAHDVELVRRANGAVHGRAERARDLDRRGADAA